MFLNKFVVKVRTALALSPVNLWRVAWYRIWVRLGIHPVQRLRAVLPHAPFFSPVEASQPAATAPTAWRDQTCFFGWFPVAWAGNCPDWHANPFSGKRVESSEHSWWNIPDFDPEVGDIKTIWEASRFDWVLTMAQRAVAGDGEGLTRLNHWLEDWCQRNPAYDGPNWKCGQEASIRVMHLAMAALISGQYRRPLPALLNLARIHLVRIAPTLQYALAQDNNHGTSEAAALFIGGSWLAEAGKGKQGIAWAILGRRWIEERVARLVEDDGSFSQYSVTYHRVLLDTLSMVEIWRRAMGLPVFSAQFYDRARAAALWLRAFAQVENGDAPNMGANDGARLLPLTDTDYRDFRPSVQLGCALFAGARAYADPGDWDLPLQWLGVTAPDAVLQAECSRLFDQGGYAVLRQGNAAVYIRFPKFRFRPSHADALHLDFWLAGRNMLRDGGSYSYHAEQRWLDYFPGTASHNTVQFDGRDQMPRLGRFLFGDWLKTDYCSDVVEMGDSVSFSAAYRDRPGCFHRRDVVLSPGLLRVVDRVEGFRNRAVLRWRLETGDWVIEDSTVVKGALRLSVMADVPVRRREIVEGWESRYYLQKSALPVLEVEIGVSGTLTTELRWFE